MAVPAKQHQCCLWIIATMLLLDAHAASSSQPGDSLPGRNQSAGRTHMEHHRLLQQEQQPGSNFLQQGQAAQVQEAPAEPEVHGPVAICAIAKDEQGNLREWIRCIAQIHRAKAGRSVHHDIAAVHSSAHAVWGPASGMNAH